MPPKPKPFSAKPKPKGEAPASPTPSAPPPRPRPRPTIKKAVKKVEPEPSEDDELPKRVSTRALAPALPVQVIVKNETFKPRNISSAERNEVIDVTDSDDEVPNGAGDPDGEIPYDQLHEDMVDYVLEDNAASYTAGLESDNEEGDGTLLAPGDSEYHDLSVPERVEHARVDQPLPFTTRSSKRAALKATESAVKSAPVVTRSIKRGRVSTGSQDGRGAVDPVTPTRNPPKRTKVQEQAPSPDPLVHKPDVSVKKSTVAKKFDFASVASQKAAAASKNDSLLDESTTYLEDLPFDHIRNKLVECEVTNKDLQDPLLIERGFYDTLPPLKSVSLVPLALKNDGMYRGLIRLSSYHTKFTDFPLESVLSFFDFVEGGGFVNPSRIHPCDLMPQRINNWTYDVRVKATKKTAIMVSLGNVYRSNVETGVPGFQYGVRQITVTLHDQEYQRLFATLGQAVGCSEFQCSIWDDAVNMSTRASKTEISESFVGSSPVKPPGDEFSSSTSPTKAFSSASGSATSAALSVDTVHPLPPMSKIPVYDLRSEFASGEAFALDENVFEHLDVFEPFEGEVPQNACVLVGYVAHFRAVNGTFSLPYRKTPKTTGIPWRLFPYIQWVLVLATR